MWTLKIDTVSRSHISLPSWHLPWQVVCRYKTRQRGELWFSVRNLHNNREIVLLRGTKQRFAVKSFIKFVLFLMFSIVLLLLGFLSLWLVEFHQNEALHCHDRGQSCHLFQGKNNFLCIQPLEFCKMFAMCHILCLLNSIFCVMVIGTKVSFVFYL